VSAPENFELLRAVPLEVTARVGSARISVAQLLELGDGSVIELDRRVSEPIEVFVGEALIARGEIVAAGDSFGVRVCEVLSAPHG
jgi:flagellar motor switch protein FliN/FliY